MSKYLIIFSIFVFSFTLHSQTIDNSWFYDIGVNTKVITNFNPITSDPGSSGFDQEWDFSDAEPRFLSEDTVNYIDPKVSRYGKSFPDADLCKTDYNQFFDTELFYAKDESSMTVIGVAFGFDSSGFADDRPQELQ